MNRNSFDLLTKEEKDQLIMDAFEMIILDMTIRIDGIRVKPSTVIKRVLFFDSSVLATILAASLHIEGAKEINRKNGILSCLESSSTGRCILKEIEELKLTMRDFKIHREKVEWKVIDNGIIVTINDTLTLTFVHTSSLSVVLRREGIDLL